MAEALWRTAAPGLAVERLPLEPLWILRVGRRALAAPGDIAAALGVAPLPVQPNIAAGSRPRALWIAPRIWMLIGDIEHPSPVSASDTVHLSSVGHGHTRFAISGERARDLLAKGCTLDFHPRNFGKDRCARTLFAQVPVIVDQVSDLPTFDLWVEVGYAEYFEAWFQDALLEFRFPTNWI